MDRQPFPFVQLPEELQRMVFRCIVYSYPVTPSQTLFRPHHLTYAGVCRKWKGLTRNFVSEFDLYSIALELDGKQGPLLKERMKHAPSFVASWCSPFLDIVIEDRYDGGSFDLDWRYILPDDLLCKVLEAASELRTLVLELCGDREGVEKVIRPRI